MPLILVHSPKGGTGTTFLAAQLALHLAERGYQVTAVDFAYQDSLKLHFGIRPSQPLAQMDSAGGEAMVVSGVDLRTGFALSHEHRFPDMLQHGGGAVFDPHRITILDVASETRALKALLLPLCDLHICPILPTAASLAALPQVEPGTPTTELKKTGFVLNQLDDTRRLSRHTHSFVRELFADALLGTVRRDEGVNEALAMFEPIGKFAPSSVVRIDLDRLTSMVEYRLGLTDAPQPGDAYAASLSN